ncbi:hypothetical protein OC842_006479 [Tilletia horrida]|uniref:Zn(2)-C6 fungal-type domain-containing protein n=1 Tax=Tilletia horrida TaxID=155126 RepID=A0AAN6GA55_9BASI|nr:hypothetical protein OC842_006479 [Tilletia horrida]
MNSIDPAKTMASGHVVAAADGSEDGLLHHTSPSAASSSSTTAAAPAPAAANSAEHMLPAHSSFSLSVPTSEASLSFSVLSTVAGDEPIDDLTGEHGIAKRESTTSSSPQKLAEGTDASALGPAPLRRNQACLSCRKRKLRCDAARPVCATCARSRAAAAAANHPAPIPPGDCVYDDVTASTRRQTGESVRPRSDTTKSGAGGRKSGGGAGTAGSAPGLGANPGAPSSAGSLGTAAARPKGKDDQSVNGSSSGIPISVDSASETAPPPLIGNSPESSMSITSSAPRAQKRKKRDDGTAQVPDTVHSAMATNSAVAATSAAGLGNGVASGMEPGDLERRMREFQLEDRIHHLEMLLVQSMNRNEQMQAHYTNLQSGQGGATNMQHQFTPQNTSAFNAATLASAGIPSAACNYSNAQAPAASSSTVALLPNGSQSMNVNPAPAFHASQVFSTPSQVTLTDEYKNLLSPTGVMNTYPGFTGSDDAGGAYASGSAAPGIPTNAFAGPSTGPLPGGIPTGLHPNAMSMLSNNRVADEINNVLHSSPGNQGGQAPDPFLELLWPGWPKDLPSPDTVHHLAEIFFAKCPLRGMIHKGQFMAGLLLPPRHPGRPHDALLHAVLAVAAPMSPHFKSRRSNPLAAGVVSPEARSMGAFSDPECVVPMVGDPHRRQQELDPSKLSFADFHLSQARLKIEQSMKTSTRNPIHWLQASTLGAYALWADGRFVEGFMLSGVLSRSAAPVGLFKLQSRHAAEPQIPASLLAPPSSATEEHERRTLMWYIYLNDVYQSGAGLYWEPVIEDAAIQTSLPVPMMQWQAGLDPPPNHQVLSSPDLFTNSHMDDFVLHIKSGVILKRVQIFIARNNITMFTTKRPAGYRALDNTINEFLASFTGSHHLEFGPNVTMDRLLAYNNVLLATILLHENFVSLSDRTSYSNVRTEQATKAVLQTIYELLATSFDFNLLHPYIYMAWTIAARMICRELTWQRIFGDAKVAMEVSQALDTVIEALRRGGEKHLVAARSAILLDRFRQGHWSEEMLSGSIFIDGVLPGEEGENVDNRPAPKVTAPTKPGQPVHYYPLKGTALGEKNRAAGVDGGSSGSVAGSSSAGGGGGGSGGTGNAGIGSSATAGGLPPLDVAQVAAAAAAAFANWMPEMQDAMRSSADPFLHGRGGAAATGGAAAGGSGGGNGGGGGGGSGVPSPESIIRPMTAASAGSNTNANNSSNSPAPGSASAHQQPSHRPGAGGGGVAMQMSPAPSEVQPNTPWMLMNILAPEQEGLD